MLTITVYGSPAPMGSKRFVGHAKSGRGILVESCVKVKPWREAVVWAAREAIYNVPHPLRGAIDLNITFTVPKPKSAPKTRRTFPDRKPDIDKLCRSTLDALVTAGVIEDDARVICLRAAKEYPNEGQDALDVPGAVIKIRTPHWVESANEKRGGRS